MDREGLKVYLMNYSLSSGLLHHTTTTTLTPRYVKNEQDGR